MVYIILSKIHVSQSGVEENLKKLVLEVVAKFNIMLESGIIRIARDDVVSLCATVWAGTKFRPSDLKNLESIKMILYIF